MRWIIISAGVVLVVASLARAFDEPKKPPAKESPPAKKRSADTTKLKDAEKKDSEKKDSEKSDKSVAEQIAAVQMELGEQQQKLVKEYRAAKDDEERTKIVEQFNKLQAGATEKYLAIVKENSDDKDLFPALQALIFSGQHTQLAVDLLLKHHVDNPQIGMLCFQLGQQGAPGSETLMRAVAEKSKSDDAKGSALLALGQSLFAQSNQDQIADDKRDELRQEAETALQTVIDKYADAKLFNRKAGDMASGILFEVKHLAVGKEVPDLEGDDLDGTAFKLSDYRGKVVFLDFWAHW
jgi:hypothetical protein